MNIHDERNQTMIFTRFLSAFHNIKLYGSTHNVSEKSLIELKDTIDSILQENDEFTLVFRGWHVYFCGERVKISSANFSYIMQLIDLFQGKNTGGIKISKGFTIQEISLFMELLTKENITIDEITQKLTESGCISIVVIPLFVQPTELLDPRKRVKQVYFETINLVKNLATQSNLQRSTYTKFTVGVLYLIDTLKTSESLLLGLTVVKNYDDFLYNHSVNTAILSLSLGVRIGLKSKELLRLGQSAILHDIGMINVPRHILKKESLLSDEEWRIVKTHPISGVQIVLDLMGLSEETAPILITVIEHQKGYDGTGYPEFIKNQKISLYARIIQIADFYDAVTTPRFYNPIPMSPAEAIAYLIRYSGQLFDPIISKHFINILGIYPLGSLVFLSTGEWGLVIGQPQDPSTLHKPLVLIIKDSDGKDIDHKMIDLSQSEIEIMKADSPWKYGIDPAEYLI
ncbi:MAG TPA: HD-GYP domain-containing protein [Candidatus Hydrothermia bacterium]|nr:HD-GYP domain-containing protein [Candidatus Hydrothermae bacterium]HRD22759.1 HD-GYP domain-containing protein [Candidatus Hydrothermia bacterium]